MPRKHAPDVRPGDTWAGIVRDSVRDPTVVHVHRVCPETDGPYCLDADVYTATPHAHISTVTSGGLRRPRTILLSKFRAGPPIGLDEIRRIGGVGGYHLIDRTEETSDAG